MVRKKTAVKAVRLAKEAAKMGRRLERRGPFRPRTFEVDVAVLDKFLAEVERLDMRQKDAVSDALELWIKS